jgi:hypothetical protein
LVTDIKKNLQSRRRKRSRKRNQVRKMNARPLRAFSMS